MGVGTIYAQNQTEIDRIEAELISFQKSGKLDSNKIISYHKIFDKYRHKDFSRAEKIGKLVIKTCEILNSHFLLSDWYGKMGNFYREHEIFSLALNSFKKGKRNSQILGEDNYWWTLNIGNIYFSQGDYAKAAKYYHEAIRDFTKKIKPNYKNPHSGIAVAYSNLGLIFIEVQQFDSALVMFHKSYLSRKILESPFDLAYITRHIADAHFRKEEYDSALFYLNKALFYDNQIKIEHKKQSPRIYNKKAEIYLKLNMYDKTLEMLDSAILLSKKYNNNKVAVFSYIMVIEIQNKHKMYNKAIKNALIALKLSKKNNYNRISADILKSLSALYSKTKSYDLAYKYQSEYLSLQDAINKQNLNILLYKFEAEQSEQKVLFLEKELSLSDKEKTTYKYLVFAGSSLLIVLLLFFIVIMRGSRTLRKKNIKIDHQNGKISAQLEEISQQNEEISVHNELLNDKNEQLSEAMTSLKEAQTQLVHSEKMVSLGVLTAGIAHEINNPVNFIYTGVNSLQKDFKDIDVVLKEVEKLTPATTNLKEEIKKIKKLKEEYYFSDAYNAINETIQDIKTGSERTTEIVKGLRNFSRADKGEFILADIHEGIDASLLMLKSKYKNKIEIHKSYDKDLPKIECLPGKLNQAILNILNNAIDAISDKGVINISTKIVKSYIFVYIKDNGLGISSEKKSHIFEPFYTSKDVGKGVGLGLSITYGIIKEHGGEIELETEQGKGTEFIIKLPIKQAIA